MIGDIIKYLKYSLYLPLALIAFVLIRLISKIFLIRFNFLPTARIGHLAIETELYLCEKRKINSLDIFSPHKIISNKFLLSLIQKKLILIPSKFMFLLIKINEIIGNKKHLANLTEKSASGDRDINNILDKTKPNLSFKKIDIKNGDSFLNKIETSKNNYVCVHIRDEKYLEKKFPDDKNLSRHSHRNVDAINYTDAIQYLVDQNITVIRMGQAGSKKINIDNKRFIDYANSKYVSNFLDIYLPANCKFFISSCSGLDFVAKIFRRPILFTNQVPIGTSVLSSSKDMIIFKKYFSLTDNRYLPISEIFEKNLELIRNGDEFDKLKINIIENNNIEILESTKDMIKFLRKDLNENKLEIHFKDKLSKQMKKKCTFDNWHNQLKSRIGPSYLELNEKIYN